MIVGSELIKIDCYIGKTKIKNLGNPFKSNSKFFKSYDANYSNYWLPEVEKLQQQFETEGKQTKIVETTDGTTYKVYLLFDYQTIENEGTENERVVEDDEREIKTAKEAKKQEIETTFSVASQADEKTVDIIKTAIVSIVGKVQVEKNEDGTIANVVFESGRSIKDVFETIILLIQTLPADKQAGPLQSFAFLKNQVVSKQKTFFQLVYDLVHSVNEETVKTAKRQELLQKVDEATTIDEVNAIDIETAQQEVEKEIAALEGIENGVEGVEGL